MRTTKWMAVCLGAALALAAGVTGSAGASTQVSVGADSTVTIQDVPCADATGACTNDRFVVTLVEPAGGFVPLGYLVGQQEGGDPPIERVGNACSRDGGANTVTCPGIGAAATVLRTGDGKDNVRFVNSGSTRCVLGDIPIMHVTAELGAGDDTLTPLISTIGGSCSAGLHQNTTYDVALTADGGSGNDTIFAGKPGAVLRGGSGNDALQGGPGPDTLIGGPGADKLLGNLGFDKVSYEQSTNNVVVTTD